MSKDLAKALPTIIDIMVKVRQLHYLTEEEEFIYLRYVQKLPEQEVLNLLSERSSNKEEPTTPIAPISNLNQAGK